MLFCFFLDVATQLGQRRVTVHLDSFDRRLILLVDLAYPRHATDRIQTQIHELDMLLHIALSHLQLVRQERFEARGDGSQNIAVER